MSEHPLAAHKPALFERLLMRWPSQCAVCRAWSHQHVCADCLLRFARPLLRCWTCAARLPQSLSGRPEPRCGQCLQAPPPLERTIAALDYAFPWDGLVRQYKFHQAIELRAALLERMEQALNAADAEAPDWLLPVPLTPQRQRERGYNQCFELARVLGKRHKIRCDLNLLLRVRDTARQAQLPLRDRSANVKQAFALEPGRAQELRGKRVVLLDDVMTSGATLFEIARVLRSAGAANVQAWVLARTPDPAFK